MKKKKEKNNEHTPAPTRPHSAAAAHAALSTSARARALCAAPFSSSTLGPLSRPRQNAPRVLRTRSASLSSGTLRSGAARQSRRVAWSERAPSSEEAEERRARSAPASRSSPHSTLRSKEKKR